MADGDVKITVRAVDQASKNLKKVEGSMKSVRDAGKEAGRGIDITGILQDVALTAGTMGAAMPVSAPIRMATDATPSRTWSPSIARSSTRA